MHWSCDCHMTVSLSVQFVGITCGLSAPYVAGQIAYAMEQVGTSKVYILICTSHAHIHSCVPHKMYTCACTQED